jgi:hypothetical protein
MQARYRTDYPGEFVILETRWSDGKKKETREWIENPINNQHISGRAVVIGSTIQRDKNQRNTFNHKYLEKHRGGLRGSLTMQTYGIAEIAKEMKLDFTVDTVLNNLKPLIENKYTEQNIVYTTARNCILHPGEFYLIPQNPHLSTIALPVYLAAFDGHKEVYLIGYNEDSPHGTSDYVEQIAAIIEAYSGTLFTFVGREGYLPERWLDLPNVRIYDYWDFVSYCDV